jgi:hypothetical protein
MNTATARNFNVQMQDLIERFAVLFPRWPSLAPARDAVRLAARKLDEIDAGRNPFGENPDPAAQAISRPYSFLFYMTQTATASDPAVLESLEFKRIPPPATDVPQTIAHVAAQIARVEALRAAGQFTPAATPSPQRPQPTTAQPGQTITATSSQAQAPGSYQLAQPTPAIATLQAPAAAWSPSGSVLRSGVASFAPTGGEFGPETSQEPAAAAKGNAAAIAALIGFGVLVLMRRKGGKR